MSTLTSIAVLVYQYGEVFPPSSETPPGVWTPVDLDPKIGENNRNNINNIVCIYIYICRE